MSGRWLVEFQGSKQGEELAVVENFRALRASPYYAALVAKSKGSDAVFLNSRLHLPVPSSSELPAAVLRLSEVAERVEAAAK